MKNSIISEYWGILSERMKADRLLEENGEPLFQSEADFVRYCKQIIRDRELEILKSEVMSLEKLANGYQKQFNIVGSVHKAFSKKPCMEKHINICILNSCFWRSSTHPCGLWTGF